MLKARIEMGGVIPAKEQTQWRLIYFKQLQVDDQSSFAKWIEAFNFR